EGADDVLDVAAGAERAARAGEHDRADAGLGVQRAEGVAQLLVDLEGEGVEPRGTVQRDRGDAGGGIMTVEERLRLDRHRGLRSDRSGSDRTRGAGPCRDVPETPGHVPSPPGRYTTAVASISTTAPSSTSAET